MLFFAREMRPLKAARLFFVQKYLEIHSECDLFILQIHAFLDNYFDVGQLLEDSETKQQAIGKVSELEEQLGVVSVGSEGVRAIDMRPFFDRPTSEYKT